ncbi:MAG: fibronectin type III domain-containing protein [Candidatus Kerfeldbacteria bacterium]|nr:fibronectin type III domain-containing protein [Candidatus Kerfeldbacteria bacterium]
MPPYFSYKLGRHRHVRWTAIVALLVLLVQMIPVVQTPTAYAFSTLFPFTASGDYDFDSTKIQVTGGQAQLGRDPDWWDTDYTYRQQLTVTASSTAIAIGDTLTLNADIDALVTASKMQADFDDLRIVYWDGATNTDLDREYLAEGLGNPTSNNDVRFPAQAAISASGTDDGYFLYYGNPSATAGPQDEANIYQYFEDFSTDVCSGGSWTCTDGSWSTAGGILDKTADGSNDDYAYNTVDSFALSGKWMVESSWRRVNNQNTVSPTVVHGATTLNLGWWMTTSNFGGVARNVEIRENTGLEISGSVFSVTNSTWYRGTLRFQGVASSCSGAQFTGYINGTQYLNGTENDNSNCPSGLHPSAHTWTAQGEWDDMKWWPYLAETVTAGSEELTYPDDDPTISPVVGDAIPFTTLSGFTEVSTLNGGAIEYMLSNDGGTTWNYHDGLDWTVSNETFGQSNTAAEVDAAISSFPVGDGSFLFQAFLDSDGTQLVQLDSVTVDGNLNPNVPTLSSPLDGADVSTFRPDLVMAATDDDGDDLQYRLQLDTVNTFDSVDLQTFTQSASQAGWSGQDTGGGTTYASGTSATFTPTSNLDPDTTYYWRAGAFDPSGSATYSAYSGSRSFTTPDSLTITDVAESAITTTSATITWTTNNAADSLVDYGTSTGVYTESAGSATDVTSHEVALADLTPDTTYYYQVTSEDTFAQTQTSAEGTFATLEATAITNPAVSTTTTTATVTWDTNHGATSVVDYGLTDAYGQQESDASLVTSHSVVLTGLDPDTTYHYAISSTGNTTDTTPDATFTTEEEPTPVIGGPPTPTILRPTPDETYRLGKPLIIGLAQAGNDVIVVIDGEIAGIVSATDDASGTGNFAFVADVIPGAHTVAVRARDADDAVSGLSDAVRFFYELPFPTPTLYDAVIDGNTATIPGLAWQGSTLMPILNGVSLPEYPTAANDAQVVSFAYPLRDLQPGEYLFQARAHDAAGKTSGISRTVHFTIGFGDVSGTVPSSPTTPITPGPGDYIVVTGDSLWAIAVRLFGDGTRWREIATANTDRYPSLATQPSLIYPGWIFRIPGS